jgi:hypothetical protein
LSFCCFWLLLRFLALHLFLPALFVSSGAERMRTVSPNEWTAILARAKEKKEQVTNVDPTAALKIQDSGPSKGTKGKIRTGVVKPTKTARAGSDTVPIVHLDAGKPSPAKKGGDHNDETADKGDDLGPSAESPIGKASGESSRGGRVVPPSPLGDTFDTKEFIKSNFMLEVKLERFESMDVRVLRKLAIGFEFKGLLLNYFLSARQESDVEKASRKFEDRLAELRKTLEASHATSVEELVESHRAALDKTKVSCEDRLRALKEIYSRDRAESEEKLRSFEKDARNFVKARNSLIVALAMAEDDAAGFEDEVVELEESNAALKDALGEKNTDGFAAALEQIRVLFPGLDEEILGQADFLNVVEDGKLVSRIPVDDKVLSAPSVDEQPGSHASSEC